LTGSTTNAAVRLINVPKVGQYTALDLGAFIVFFGLGAFVAGFILGPGRMRWGRLQVRPPPLYSSSSSFLSCIFLFICTAMIFIKSAH
jgi:hypothetical protein